MLAYSNLAFDRAGSVRRYDTDNRLHIADAILTCSEVAGYLAAEIPDFEALGLDRNKIYKLWRHPDELRVAAPTFNRLPVLDRHTPVNADEPRKDLVIGTTGSDAVFSNGELRNSLAIWDGRAISDIQEKERCALSAGYHYRARMTAGVTPKGEPYQGIMTRIRGNHVALVNSPRCASAVIGDSRDHLHFSILARALKKFAEA